jgi:uncharacterized damage-inducible protein DinB
MPAEQIALIFKLNNGLVTRVLEGLDDDDVWRRPGDAGNPIGWLVGHVTIVRSSLLAELGAPFDHGLGSVFSRGEAIKDRSSYPPRTAIEAAWHDTHARMRDAFAAITDAWLAEPSRGKPLPGAKTMADRLSFLAFHESYHVGQMAYVRRLIGRSGVAG